MSVQAISWAFAQDVSPASHKLVLIALANRSDEEGFCYPSYRWLAGQTSQDERTCQRAVTALMEQGFLTKSERFRTDGTQDRNLYQILLGGRAADCHPRAADCRGEGVTSVTPNTKINKKNKNPLTRDEFLREVGEGVKGGTFNDVLSRFNLTADMFLLCAGDAWDYWAAYNKFPEDFMYGLKGWARGWKAETQINQKRLENISKPTPDRDHAEWSVRVSTWQSTKFWPDQFGAAPDKRGTRVPASVLKTFNINQTEMENY
jgi:hypothetical protein